MPPVVPGNEIPANTKCGNSQEDAGAHANERWYTIGHPTLPDGILMVGL